MKTRNFPAKKLARKLNAEFRKTFKVQENQAGLLEAARAVRTKKDRRSLAKFR